MQNYEDNLKKKVYLFSNISTLRHNHTDQHISGEFSFIKQLCTSHYADSYVVATELQVCSLGLEFPELCTLLSLFQYIRVIIKKREHFFQDLSIKIKDFSNIKCHKKMKDA